jgi:hypothetical protein
MLPCVELRERLAFVCFIERFSTTVGIPRKVGEEVFRRKKARRKTSRKMGGWCLEGCRRFAPDTEVEGYSKGDRSLEEGDWGVHGPKTG